MSERVEREVRGLFWSVRPRRDVNGVGFAVFIVLENLVAERVDFRGRGLGGVRDPCWRWRRKKRPRQ